MSRHQPLGFFLGDGCCTRVRLSDLSQRAASDLPAIAANDDEKTKRQIEEVTIERFDHGLSPQLSPHAQLQSQAHAQLQLQFE
jgi:hypothetical protein